MGKAKPENCTHPSKNRATGKHQGMTVCNRCDSDLTSEWRSFVHRLSERVVLTPGEKLHVRAHGSNTSFDGVFMFAELGRTGWAIVISERQTVKIDKEWITGQAAIRAIRPEHVSRAAGVRDRTKREEHAA